MPPIKVTLKFKGNTVKREVYKIILKSAVEAVVCLGDDEKKLQTVILELENILARAKNQLARVKYMKAREQYETGQILRGSESVR